MTVLAWIFVAVWSVILLAGARAVLRRLPAPTDVVPPYVLWLPRGGVVPDLEPAPARVHHGLRPPAECDRILALGNGVEVSRDLPGRLAACGADFVSVFPLPARGNPVARAVERVRRDVARPETVVDPQSPTAFADERCAWLRRADLDLPGEGADPVLRAARARAAHAFPVDIRDPRATDDSPCVRAPALSLKDHRDRFPDLMAVDPAARLLSWLLPPLLCLGPLALLFVPAVRGPVLLALGLGTAARLMAAVRDGFGYELTVLGWLAEPVVALTAVAAERLEPAPFPELPARLRGRDQTVASWLDGGAVPWLARRLGAAAPVLEQVYDNRPTGRTRVGRIIDRALHQSPTLRALRHRRVMAAEVVRALAPRRLLSVPCGSAREPALIGATETVLVDDEPEALARAAVVCPGARVVRGDVERAPAGVFDVVLFLGATERLDDRALVRAFSVLRGRVAEGGALVTSCTADHPQRSRAARWLGWEMRLRTPDALVSLLDAAGYRLESRHADPMGIQWIFVARPRPLAESDQHNESNQRSGSSQRSGPAGSAT